MNNDRSSELMNINYHNIDMDLGFKICVVGSGPETKIIARDVNMMMSKYYSSVSIYDSACKSDDGGRKKPDTKYYGLMMDAYRKLGELYKKSGTPSDDPMIAEGADVVIFIDSGDLLSQAVKDIAEVGTDSIYNI